MFGDGGRESESPFANFANVSMTGLVNDTVCSQRVYARHQNIFSKPPNWGLWGVTARTDFSVVDFIATRIREAIIDLTAVLFVESENI